MKLLSYTTRYFAGLLLLALSVFTTIFYFQMLDEIYDSLDDGLQNQKILVINRAKKNPEILNKNKFEDGYYTIHKVKYEQIKEVRDIYRDTLMYMLNEKDYEPVRLLETVFEQEGNYYKLKVITSMVEEDDLIEDLLYSILFLYLGLVLCILVLNNFILKRLWKPFYSLLNKLKNFNIEKQELITFEETNIQEFKLLNKNIDRLLKKSIDSFKAQQQFIENASHELQTPLAISINKLELLAENEKLSEEQMHILATTLDNLERMTRLNKSLLLLSKIENKQFIEEENIQLSKVLDKISIEFSDLLEHKNITLNKNFESDIAIKMNKDLAIILFTNLIKNAILHSEKNSEIEVKIASNKVSISNYSTTTELNPNKLYTRFYKTGNNKNSTGLGLAIAKAITDKYALSLTYHYNKRHHFTVNFD
ncbi:Signal transduction histidine kinase [Mesonia phycicola]|uniref:histidine kinase n=1 Tax=Mesonia phycicola TaxID=579105 RepID=A0A1M6A5K4_9FLAO|nr:HAMP domain-containing sensor histidine kinase [Mesonia phycicola]SHI31483.1 Signal transduction histidine kinase [Mesonia phycicola]